MTRAGRGVMDHSEQVLCPLFLPVEVVNVIGNYGRESAGDPFRRFVRAVSILSNASILTCSGKMIASSYGRGIDCVMIPRAKRINEN